MSPWVAAKMAESQMHDTRHGKRLAALRFGRVGRQRCSRGLVGRQTGRDYSRLWVSEPDQRVEALFTSSSDTHKINPSQSHQRGGRGAWLRFTASSVFFFRWLL